MVASSDLSKYVADARAKGASVFAIKKKLLQAGWGAPDVDAAFREPPGNDFSLPAASYVKKSFGMPSLPSLSLPKMPSLGFPSLNLSFPSLSLPTFSLPKISVPAHQPLSYSAPSLPSVSLPKFLLPRFSLPVLPAFSLPKISFKMPVVRVPTFSLPKVFFPSFSRSMPRAPRLSYSPRLLSTLPALALPVLALPKIAFSLALPALALPRITLPSVKLPSFAPPRFAPPSFPRVNVPSLREGEAFIESHAPRFEAPHFNTPRFDAPRINAPKFEPPHFAAPRFDAPRFSAPRFSLPKLPVFALPALALPVFALPPFALPALALPRFGLPSFRKNALEYRPHALKVFHKPPGAHRKSSLATPPFEMPKIVFPRVSLPKFSFKLPRIAFPKVFLPKFSFPKISAGRSAHYQPVHYVPRDEPLLKLVPPVGQHGIVGSWVYALVFPANVFRAENFSSHGFERVIINFCLPWLFFFTLFFSSRVFTPGSIGQVGFPEVAVAFVVLAFLSSALFANFGVLHAFLVVVAAKAMGCHKANLALQARLFSVAYGAGGLLLAGVLFAVYSLRVVGLQQIAVVFSVVWALYWLALLSLATREATGLPFIKSIVASVVPTCVLFGIVIAAVSYLNALPA